MIDIWNTPEGASNDGTPFGGGGFDLVAAVHANAHDGQFEEAVGTDVAADDDGGRHCDGDGVADRASGKCGAAEVRDFFGCEEVVDTAAERIGQDLSDGQARLVFGRAVFDLADR